MSKLKKSCKLFNVNVTGGTNKYQESLKTINEFMEGKEIIALETVITKSGSADASALAIYYWSV
jgi:hypothetical protein